MEETKLRRKFKIEFSKNWFGKHIGIFFCVEFIDAIGKKDRYILIGLWKYDLTIGFITE